MADTAELRQMVLTFRVSELQVLLGYAGRNKTGRKQDLMARALLLVDKGASLPVQIKIKDLYRSVRRCPSSAMPPVNQHPPNNTHIPVPVSGRQSNVPVHPDVKLTKLPFYDQLAELLKPTSLVQAPNNRFQETNFTFHLTPQQAQNISVSRLERRTMPGVKYEYETQIQLRFSLLETSCEQADNFPPSICVRVNSKLAQLPNPIQSTKPGVEPRRPSRPVDITCLCRLSPTLPNHIDVSWASEFSRSYCIAVYLVRKLSPDDLLHRLRQTGHRHPDHSRALVKEKLAPDPDSEIAMTCLRVSLLCPLGKMTMKVPCRASTCMHLQCFDAETYLRMNEKKPTWVCPVCDRKTCFSNLIIDGLFMNILRQANDFSDIKFTGDGQWHPVKECSESVDLFSSPAPSHTAASKRPIEHVTDITDSEPEAKKVNLDVIDLTEDTDDDSDATIASPYSVNPSSNDDSVINIDTPPHAASPNSLPPTLTYHPPTTTSGTYPPPPPTSSIAAYQPPTPTPVSVPEPASSSQLFLDSMRDLSNKPLPAHQQRPTYASPDSTLPQLPHLIPRLGQNYDNYLSSLMMRPMPTTSTAHNYYNFHYPTSLLEDGSTPT